MIYYVEYKIKFDLFFPLSVGLKSIVLGPLKCF